MRPIAPLVLFGWLILAGAAAPAAASRVPVILGTDISSDIDDAFALALAAAAPEPECA
jgi:hypothetical protein